MYKRQTIYSTNITPDNDTGIGRWSYSAFERAMREGVHQDGRQLYPAFPYTAFAKMSDADMQALYGYLMSQPAVRAEPPRTELAFPYNLRPTLAGWNMLFHDNTPYRPDPRRASNGTAAPTWCRARATAAPVTRHATAWAPKRPARPTSWPAAAPKAGTRPRSTGWPKDPGRGPRRNCTSTCGPVSRPATASRPAPWLP